MPQDGERTLVLPGAGSVSYFQVYYCKVGYDSEIYVWSTWSSESISLGLYLKSIIEMLTSPSQLFNCLTSVHSPTLSSFFHFLNKSPISFAASPMLTSHYWILGNVLTIIEYLAILSNEKQIINDSRFIHKKEACFEMSQKFRFVTKFYWPLCHILSQNSQNVITCHRISGQASFVTESHHVTGNHISAWCSLSQGCDNT